METEFQVSFWNTLNSISNRPGAAEDSSDCRAVDGHIHGLFPWLFFFLIGEILVDH